MSSIEVQNLGKDWGDFSAISDVSFTADSGTFVVLLGPSGCGKSTLLRCIAGLETPTRGSIRIGGQDVTTADPSKRGISMVFQSYALFPHLSVAENILFGLKVRKVPAMEQQARLRDVAGIVDLAHVLNRKPNQLSGGQRQRVALARAIVSEHKTCLMDEPLSNLDAKLRHEMRVELRALQKRLGITVLYVTHDQTEAMSMADRVILLNGGKISQNGRPEDLYRNPENTFAARFIGTPPVNLLPLEPSPGGMALHEDVSQRVIIRETLDEGCCLGIRPEHLSLSLTHTANSYPVRITSEDYHGADTIIGVRHAGHTSDASPQILVRVSGHVIPNREQVHYLSISTDHIHVFDNQGIRQALLPQSLSQSA